MPARNPWPLFAIGVALALASARHAPGAARHATMLNKRYVDQLRFRVAGRRGQSE
jgi:hypothetical protein